MTCLLLRCKDGKGIFMKYNVLISYQVTASQRSDGVFSPCLPYVGLGRARLLPNINFEGKLWLQLCYDTNRGFSVPTVIWQYEGSNTYSNHSTHCTGKHTTPTLDLLSQGVSRVSSLCFWRGGSVLLLEIPTEEKILYTPTKTTNT